MNEDSLFKKSRLIQITISQQLLEVFEHQNNGEPPCLLASHPISSSKFGLGTEEGSYKTPLGNFCIEGKFGEGAPERMIFKARQATGTVAELGGEKDYVLTRIFWLKGLDLRNANTHDRFIYIHGTNQEELIGTPASHGCIRMKNHDITKLFEGVQEGDRVEIII